MPARLVYQPKAYVYTKNQAGATFNLTPWVVSGQVQRKVNQVSSAEVVLRNPYKRFTTPSQGVAFHPMDPITIYLERLNGFPVRVFTGYLDSTPYYQMFPGTITLQASCTLKRLLYTFFDPSLPFVIAFFEKYGWINTGKGSLFNPNAIGGPQPTKDVHLQDSSLGKLLWATLYEIGEWQDTNIYVESLPDGIAQRMTQLMSSLQASQQEASSDFTTFLSNVIGGGSQGSGGGNLTIGGTIIGTSLDAHQKQEAATLISTGIAQGAPKEALLAVLCAGFGESNMGDDPTTYTGNGVNPSTTQGKGYWGVLQGNPTYFPDPHDTAAFATAFMQGGKGFGNGPGANGRGAIALVQAGITDPGTIALGEEDSGQSPGYYGKFQNQAQAVLNAYSGIPSSTGSPGQSIANTVSSTVSAITQTITGSTAPAVGSGSGKINIANMLPDKPSPNRIDEGVDYSGSGRICAIADSVFVDYLPGAYAGDLLLMRFTQPPLSQGGCGGDGSYYVAEHISNNINVSKGKTVPAGTVIATMSGGIEVGWWGNGGSCGSPQVPTHDSGGPQTSAWGADFSSLVVASGGPAGVTENPPQGGTPINDWKKVLAGKANFVGPGAGGGGGGGAAGSVASTNTAEAFVAELQFPSIEEQVTAIALGAEHKGLMHDQSLMPFVQQLAQSSLRSFQSLPNGDFYAFYPDYFGEFGHHDPYWDIHDIEILDGGINLTDDGLATHVFAVGDNTWPVNQELLNMLFSAGSINIFNAFLQNSDQILDKTNPFASGKLTKAQKGMEAIMSADEAVKFIERYGARPLVQNYPMVHSNLFEMLLAYQQFMIAWSNQFKTPFTFTFMPELFPGGKVGFADHGIQMYVDSVTHSWNYAEGGFTTTAELSAPSTLQGATPENFPDLPFNPPMVAALVEPVRQGPSGSVGQNQAEKQAAQNIASILTGGGIL